MNKNGMLPKDWTRKEALNAYLTLVVRDLLMRGMIRSRLGHSPLDIAREEPVTVVASVLRDFKDSGIDILKSVRNDAISAIVGKIFG